MAATSGCRFAEVDKSDLPLTLYAATKKSGEALSHAYAHLFEVPTTNLRFFTVYGPWGRPDMALFKFTKAIMEDEPIELYNYGRMTRDFTFIDDLAAAILALIEHVPGAAPIGPHDTLSPGRAAPRGQCRRRQIPSICRASWT